MDFEEFKEFMLQSAAQHDVRIAQIEESMKAANESIARLANATAILVDNQVHLQENIDRLSAISERQGLRIERLDDAFDKRMTRISERLDKLSEIVFRHVTDSNEHGQQPN